jgi:uncharacterized membrane protein YccC
MLIKTMLAFRPSKTDVIFSLKTFFAAMLALYIAITLNLQNPMWAMGTVFIVANPMAGVLSSKAVFRLMGTFAGACVSLIILPPFINSPLPFTLVIASWVSLCLYISLLDRTPRSYFFMLAGYTAALIGFSAVPEPTNLFMISLSRFEEITLGILCATVVTRVVYPMSIGPVLSGRINKWIHDVELNFKHAMTNAVSPASIIAETQRFAGDVTELHGLAIHLSYENSFLKGKTKAIQALQHQMILLLPALVSLSNRVQNIVTENPALQPYLDKLYQDTEIYLHRTTDQLVEGQDLPDHLLQHFNRLMSMANTQQQLLIMNAREAYIFFVQHYQNIRLIWNALQHNQKIPDSISKNNMTYQTLHRDHGVALRSAISAFLAIVIVCFLWFMSGWPMGYMAAQLTAVCACILTFLDNPVPALASFIKASLISSVVVFIYQFGIFPEVSNFTEMMIVIFPLFFIFGMMLTSPVLMSFSLPMLIIMAMSLNIRNINTTNFTAFMDSSMASVLGVIIPSFTIALIRSMSPEHSVHRLMVAQWREIRELIDRPVMNHWAYYVRRMLDRIGLMTPRLLKAPAVQQHIAESTIELSGAINIIRLKRVQPLLDEATNQQVQTILDQLKHWYAARIHDTTPDPQPILKLIDALMNQQLCQPSTTERDQLLVSAIGLRQALFQTEASYQPACEAQSIAALGETYGWRN